MDIIDVKVNGHSISKDNNCAGTQYESNSTKLRITFGENWDGYGKKITFWNALGQNPVVIQLGSNLLEDITTNQRVYLVPIPGEAMTESGENTFVIQGYVDNTVKRTVEGKLKVLPSRHTDNASDPEDITPTQAEQFRVEIDAVLSDIAEAKKGAEAAERASGYAKTAEEASGIAVSAMEAIEGMTVSAEPVNGNATVTKTKEKDAFNLHFGIPKGNPGVHIGSEAPTDPDINVWVDTSGSVDVVGDIISSLDTIISLQTELIGGGGV